MTCPNNNFHEYTLPEQNLPYVIHMSCVHRATVLLALDDSCLFIAHSKQRRMVATVWRSTVHEA